MKKLLYGNDGDRIHDVAFRLMEIFFKVYYFIRPPGRYLEKFGIQPGFKVVDYGCGPGAYIKSASERVGDNGLVYAVDVQELAISSVQKIITKHDLKNVVPMLSVNNRTEIPGNSVDLIYALDMFHMVSDPSLFLEELRRIARWDVRLILEDGHQPRDTAMRKIQQSGSWEITDEQTKFFICRPLK